MVPELGCHVGYYSVVIVNARMVQPSASRSGGHIEAGIRSGEGNTVQPAVGVDSSSCDVRINCKNVLGQIGYADMPVAVDIHQRWVGIIIVRICFGSYD